MAQSKGETSKKVRERRIVLLGKTGLGKSASANTILGKEVFESEFSFESVTQVCSTDRKQISVTRISVTDTPGLFDTGKTKEELKGEIEKCLKLSKPGPHAFLLVTSLDVTFTEEEQEAVRWVQKNFGEEALRHFSIVLLTHGDVLGEETVEDYIGKSNFLSSVVSQCGGRYHVFNNEERKDRTQVLGLLEKIEAMVKSNREKYYTGEMYKESQRKIGGEGQTVDPLLHQVKNMTVGLQEKVARNRNMKELQINPIQNDKKKVKPE